MPKHKHKWERVEVKLENWYDDCSKYDYLQVTSLCPSCKKFKIERYEEEK